MARVGAGPVLGMVTSFFRLSVCYVFGHWPAVFILGWLGGAGDGSHECLSCAGVWLLPFKLLILLRLRLACTFYFWLVGRCMGWLVLVVILFVSDL